MSRGPYALVTDGEWTPMRMKGHREQCCDCSLVHRIDYRIIRKGNRNEIEFRCWRDDRATDRIRKRRGIAVRAIGQG